ncbi:MAG TPA: hypothetical protein VG758_01135 [Hyphomicrobiaceae bacterium]|jgi:2-polyprenyl-6-methoxyphenol hydroxylase-like FAD-dependent oxidoreductase|nr:hypothetical protein [Hyphomicrobiaceae bacterium]
MTPPGASARAAYVIGDGPAALTAATALAQRGWAVDLTGWAKPDGRHTRVDVLGGAALGPLARLGISRDDLLAVARPCPGTWSRWGKDSHCLDHASSLHGAWAVDRAGLIALLRQRALSAGVRLLGSLRADAPVLPCEASEPWTIVAAGTRPARSGDADAGAFDDRLVALLGRGTLMEAAGSVDTRLLIEAHPEGWIYGVVGPRRTVCVGIVTDAQALQGTPPAAFAAKVLSETERIARLTEAVVDRLDIVGIPVDCRRRRLKAGRRSIRVGDAHMSFDPLAGRGLWEAIYRTERVMATLDRRQHELDSMERGLRAGYARYLQQRAAFYREGYARFGTGFWARRGTVPP